MECERFTASVTTNVRAGIAQAFRASERSLYYGLGPTQAAPRSEASIHCCFMAKPGRMRKLSSGVSPLARGRRVGAEAGAGFMFARPAQSCRRSIWRNLSGIRRRHSGSRQW
jgi:hypothetical protein